ncbi:MAG: tetratricopeptide repeat protein [Polaromonas sp.]|nr:tetratricopeptide repeat protein [Polaromonas sp.]
MSLLLDALRRAEEDARKRKQDVSEPAAELSLREGVACGATAPVSPDLVVQATAAPEDALALELAGIDAAPQAEAAKTQTDTGFPELTLALAEPPAPASEAEPPGALVIPPASPRTPVQPYGRYVRPTGAQAEQEARFAASQSRAAAQAESKPDVPEVGAATAPPARDGRAGTGAGEPAEAAQSVLQQNRATERRALSAAGVMAGKSRPRDAGKRRQWMLVGIALVLAVPLLGFLFFGDALLGSKSTLVAANRPKPAAPLPESTPAVAVGDPAVAAAAAPAASVAASLPVAASNLPPAASAPPAPLPPSSPQPATATPVAGARSATATATPRSRAAPQASSQGTARTPASASANGPSAAVALVPNASAKPASLMDAAYAAYQAGKPAEATRLYQDVLRADPTQRDAWLGLAVIAHAGNQREPAMDAYKRVLRLEPQNATALAGLSSLITSAGEPQQESRLREMLARAPQEADLNNALGLVLSGEQRWSEAQPLFFKAHSAAPLEAQFAYNLAVTLDHLRKSALAAQYYETALGLAAGRASGFDEASARNRLTALRARAPAGPAR